MDLVWQLTARVDELPLWQEAVLCEAKVDFSENRDEEDSRKQKRKKS